MTETLFLQFTETNDHEGETWHSWLQFDGNEDELAKLRDLLSELNEGEDEGEYVLTENVEPESVVDKLVEYADSGYSKTHSKVAGVFTCPEHLGDYGDALHKSGVHAFFVEVSS